MGKKLPTKVGSGVTSSLIGGTGSATSEKPALPTVLPSSSSGPSPLATGLATLLGANPGSTPSNIPVTSMPLATTGSGSKPVSTPKPTSTPTVVGGPVTTTLVATKKTLSVQERTKQNEASKKLLTELGHLPGEPPPLPGATEAPNLAWVVTPGTGIVPKGGEAAEKNAEIEFENLYNSTEQELQTLGTVSTAEFNRLNNAGVNTWNVKNTTFVEKLAKMKAAAQEIASALTTEKQCKSEFTKIYKECNEKLLPELEKLNLDERNRLSNIATEVSNLNTTSFQAKLPQVKAARDFIQKAIDTEKAAVVERKKVCETATKEVAKWTEEHIATLGTKELIEAMAKLTCVPKADQPKEELAKLYRAMRPDPDFVDDDRGKRDKILSKLVQLGDGTESKFFSDTRSTWGTGNDLGGSSEKAKNKKLALTKFQNLQTAELGFKADPIEYTLLKKGNSGNCTGKKVKVSTNTEDNKSFDETLNTVAHETTHAYQNTLADQLTDGSLKTDDPRYAQALLFMLNNKAYAGSPEKPEPPKKLTGLDAQNPTKMAKYQTDLDDYNKKYETYQLSYAAYKNQPVEWHAWKAGDEAGRAFDISALRVNIASRLQAIIQKLGTNTEAVNQATTLQDKLSKTNTVPESIDLMIELEKLAA